MAHEDANVGRRHVASLKGRSPGGGRSAHGQGDAVDVEGDPAPFERVKPGMAEPRDDRAGLMVLVVIAEDRKLSQAALDSTEHRLDPGDRVVVLDQVAGDDDQIGRPAAASVDHRLEKPALEAGSKMEVAELQDLKAVERRGEIGEAYIPLRAAAAERNRGAGSRSSHECGPPPIKASAPFERARSSVSDEPVIPSRPAPQRQAQRGERPDDRAGNEAQECVSAQRPGPEPPWVAHVLPEQ